jgi:hypothetical protein
MKTLSLFAAVALVALLFVPAVRGFLWGVAERAHAALFNHMARSGLVLGVNNLEVHQMLAREAATIFEESAPFISHVNRAREQDFKDQDGQYKKGATVEIVVPPTATVYTGSTYAEGGAGEDTVERTVPVTFVKATDQKHVVLNLSAFEKVFNVPDARADWVDRFLKPKIASLAATVEADMIARAMKLTPNFVGTPGTPITSMATFAAARSKLQRSLTPMKDRYSLIDTSTNAGLVTGDRALFNPNAEISKQYREGYVGYAQGSEFFEIVNGPAIANSADVVGAVNGAAQSGAALVVDGLTAAPVAGMTFTIAGVFQVHPLTGVAYGSAAGDLQQFTVLPGSTTTSLLFYPAITATMPNKTVSAVPADDAVITFSGSASTTYARDLMYHRDAFTVAMRPLPVLASCEGYTYNAKGFSMRVMTFGDGAADTESTRVDVLATLAAVRGEWACGMYR